MRTLPFHNTDGFNEDTFEQFCLHMLRLLEQKNSIYKHSTKGQSQYGYDAYDISNNIFYDFKHYVKQPDLSKIKDFGNKFPDEKKNNSSKLILLFACKVERESRDPNTNNFDALENYLRVNTFLEIWDLEKISQLVYGKRLYSLVWQNIEKSDTFIHKVSNIFPRPSFNPETGFY